MKTLLQLTQFAFVAMAFYCLWQGIALLPAIGLLLAAIWLQLMLLGHYMRVPS